MTRPGQGWPQRVTTAGHAARMGVALAGRTYVVVAWLSAVVAHGLPEPAGVLVAVALVAVGVAALVRDRRAATRPHDLVAVPAASAGLPPP